MTLKKMQMVMGVSGGFPDPVEGVIMVDSETENDHAPDTAIGSFFRFYSNGRLEHLPIGATTDEDFDGVQWHEEQPTLTTNPASYYSIRATRLSYSGSGGGGSIFSFSFYSFFDSPYSTGTPTPWRGLHLGNTNLRLERFSGNGAGVDIGSALIEIARTSDEVVLASATYTVKDTVA